MVSKNLSLSVKKISLLGGPERFGLEKNVSISVFINILGPLLSEQNMTFRFGCQLGENFKVVFKGIYNRQCTYVWFIEENEVMSLIVKHKPVDMNWNRNNNLSTLAGSTKEVECENDHVSDFWTFLIDICHSEFSWR